MPRTNDVRVLSASELKKVKEFIALAGTQAEAARLMGPGAVTAGTLSNLVHNQKCSARLRRRVFEGIKRGEALLRNLVHNPAPPVRQTPGGKLFEKLDELEAKLVEVDRKLDLILALLGVE